MDTIPGKQPVYTGVSPVSALTFNLYLMEVVRWRNINVIIAKTGKGVSL